MLMGEVGWNQASGVNGDLVYDKSAWGYTVVLSMDYFEILHDLDLNVPLNFKHNPSGDSSVLSTFTEDANSMSVGFNFTFLQRYEFDVTYVNFLGDAEDNYYADRDYVSAVMRFAF